MSKKWSTRNCYQCGRDFKGCGPQQRCRKRDCQTMGETPDGTKRRLRDDELESLIREQAADQGMGRTTRKKGRRGKSISGAVSLDYLVNSQRSHGHESGSTYYELLSLDPQVPQLGIPEYMIEWIDTTFDQATPSLDTYIENLEIVGKY